MFSRCAGENWSAFFLEQYLQPIHFDDDDDDYDLLTRQLSTSSLSVTCIRPSKITYAQVIQLDLLTI